MGWDANWAATEGKGKLPSNTLNQVLDGLTERRNATLFSSPPTLPTTFVSGHLIPAWATTFQSAVSALFAKYANHTLHGGDYTGQAAIPVFSEATMLTAIGDAVRLPVPVANHLIQPWAWQQYKIINMLRWRYLAFGFFHINRGALEVFLSAVTTAQKKTSGAVGPYSFADLKSYFNGLSWASGVDDSYLGLGDPTGANSIVLGAIGWSVNPDTVQSRVSYAYTRDYSYVAFKPTIDFYLQSKARSGYLYVPSTNFDVAGKCFKYDTMDTANETDTIVAPYDTWTNLSELIEPSTFGSYASIFNHGQVAKLDVPNGFTYKDW